ncbi:hemagglutinin repeat-containing protein, partial [Escherichia coli]|nr:Contact-dependent inhibitor A [Escherichia coli]EFT3110480.1 Contact-dependent inhibitor A [Escherichia coli]EJW6285754.1 hemagglutinin repeat-containing protein [Escherichia coli]
VVDPGHDRRTVDEKFEQKKSGLTVALSGTVGSAINNAVTSAQETKESSDSRLKALQATKTALSGVQAGQAAAMATATGDPNATGVSLSLTTQKSKSQQHAESDTVSGSTLNAGNNLSVVATGKNRGDNRGDIVIAGSQLKAGGNTSLDAANDILLSGAANTQKTTGRNSSSGGGVGVSIGAGGNGAGISVFASVNAAKGKDNGNGTDWTETTIDSGKTVTINSGRYTVLNGAQVNGNRIIADVGHDLLISSQQDTSKYDSKQTSVAAGGSFTFGSMTGSGYIAASRDKMKSRFDSVAEQTGMFAGDGGFDITVGRHTQLDGAVIASTATPDKNHLDTGTLGFCDLHNEADYKVSHSGISLSGGGSFGDKFQGNMPGGMISAGGHSGHAEGTTQAAVAEGIITIRDRDNQKQNLANLSRDPAHANDSISPIFDKEKEQRRLQTVGLISDIGSQVADIARTQGELNALKAAQDKYGPVPADATEEQRQAYQAKLRDTPEYKKEQEKYGTGSEIQRGIQAATAALQGLAGGNMAGALAGASAPELANIIGHHAGIDDNTAAKAIAHAILGGVTAALQGNSAAAGAIGAGTGEVIASAIAKSLYPGVDPSKLTEEQKQTVSTLATLSAGMAGGIASGDVAGAAAGAGAGKNVVENNFLGATSSDKLDKAIEKIRNGDKTLATANELIKLENADKRSDALVSKFNKDPSQLNSAERAELAAYLRVYASEMEKEYGTAVAQELVTGLLSGQDYIKRNPDTEAMAKAQSIMNTWGYHKSNASIGDAPLLFGGSVLGLTVKGMATNAAIGISVNSAAQLAGKDPFSYVDAIIAGVTAAATTGKGIIVSTPINMSGAAIGSSIKGEDPTNSVIGTGLGSVFGGGIGKVISGSMGSTVKEGTSDIIGNIGGSITGEAIGNVTKGTLDEADKSIKNK